MAQAGLSDLDTCLPYTLVFVPQLESVAYPDHLVSLEEPEEERVDGEVQILSVTTTDFEDESVTSTIAVLSKGLTTIAMPVEQTDEGVRILPLKADLPRLFCDFPLLGTELFPFPVVVNNPTFNPTDRARRPVSHPTPARRPAERPQQSLHQRGALALPLTLEIRVEECLAQSAPTGGRKADPRWAYLGESELVQG